jgi:hypothetical protein
MPHHAQGPERGARRFVARTAQDQLRLTLLTALVLALVALATSPVSRAATTTVSPADDGYVNAAAPNRGGGTAHQLVVGRSPRRVAYLRFVVPGLARSPSHVTLRVRAVARAHGASVELRSASGRAWSEGSLTRRSAPSVGRVLGRRAHFGRGWLAFDLTAVVRRGGTYSFALSTRGRHPLRFFSKEAGSARAPHLDIAVPGGPSPKGPTSPTPPTVSPSGQSITRPVGSPILSDAAAAAHVRHEPEIRPDNLNANHTTPTAQQLSAFRSASTQPYTASVTGNFVGTTDEIIQWAAWKWGVNEDIMRAVAVQESDWHQTADASDGATFGLLQIKTQIAGGDGWPGTFPLAQASTAFNADYYGRAFRSCYDGRETWLGGSYGPGHEWDCVGLWYSGDWHSGYDSYVAEVQQHLAGRDWAQPGY